MPYHVNKISEIEPQQLNCKKLIMNEIPKSASDAHQLMKNKKILKQTNFDKIHDKQVIQDYLMWDDLHMTVTFLSYRKQDKINF